MLRRRNVNVKICEYVILEWRNVWNGCVKWLYVIVWEFKLLWVCLSLKMWYVNEWKWVICTLSDCRIVVWSLKKFWPLRICFSRLIRDQDRGSSRARLPSAWKCPFRDQSRGRETCLYGNGIFATKFASATSAFKEESRPGMCVVSGARSDSGSLRDREEMWSEREPLLRDFGPFSRPRRH